MEQAGVPTEGVEPSKVVVNIFVQGASSLLSARSYPFPPPLRSCHFPTLRYALPSAEGKILEATG